jgi:hypothetical protein
VRREPKNVASLRLCLMPILSVTKLPLEFGIIKSKMPPAAGADEAGEAIGIAG